MNNFDEYAYTLHLYKFESELWEKIFFFFHKYLFLCILAKKVTI